MTQANSVFVPPSEFDAFLFAAVGQDGNDHQLSVLSALARADVDPWQEAAELACLPGETATERLVSLIATVPGGLSTHPDPETVAARLIALLPKKFAHPMAKTLAGKKLKGGSPAMIWGVFLVFLVLGAVFIVVYR
jgi:hypothetical protein